MNISNLKHIRNHEKTNIVEVGNIFLYRNQSLIRNYCMAGSTYAKKMQPKPIPAMIIANIEIALCIPIGFPS